MSPSALPEAGNGTDAKRIPIATSANLVRNMVGLRRTAFKLQVLYDPANPRPPTLERSETMINFRHHRACPGGTMTSRLISRNAYVFAMAISRLVVASTGTSPAEAKS